MAPGWVEIETGVERDNQHGAHTFLTPTVLKLGVRPHVQLDLAGSFVHQSGKLPDYSSLGDVAVAIKWRLLAHAPVIGDFAVQPSLKFPTGSAHHGTGTTDVGLLLISSHAFAAVAVDINAGYVRRSGDGGRTPRNATLWTVSAGRSITGVFGWTGEVFGYPRTTGPAGQDGIVALLTGPTAELRRWLIIDAGVIVPLTGPQPHALYAGLTWNIGRL